MWQDTDGTLTARALGDGYLPATMSLGSNSATFYSDALNSQNIHIVVKEAGYTPYAGLKWTQPATVNIWANGIIEVDEEGISAVDTQGTAWISRRVKVASKIAVIMIRR